MFRKTALNDEKHLEFSRLFGDLDDVGAFTQAGRKNRLSSDELFDVSNLSPDGEIAPLNGSKVNFSKVGARLFARRLLKKIRAIYYFTWIVHLIQEEQATLY